MKDVILFEKLREYLTKEYMRLSEEKEELLSQKVRLETEVSKNKDFFFNRHRIEERKQFFYPFQNTVYFNGDAKEENENSIKIKKMEKNVNHINDTLLELKEYISLIQSMVKEKEDWRCVAARV